jgi:dephospho-CoA kinase
MTFVLGLTGSIGMGKTATAAIFRRLGCLVHDADQAVHHLYSGPPASAIEEAFPGTVDEAGVVDRRKLSAAVLGDAELLKRLESIVHPLVRAEEVAFLLRARAAQAPIAVLDVPLLLETGGDERCDAVAVVAAPAEVQRRRVLARPEMSEERFAALLAQQMPAAEKRRRAHFLVDTSRGFVSAEAQVRSILTALAGRPGLVLQRLAQG